VADERAEAKVVIARPLFLAHGGSGLDAKSGGMPEEILIPPEHAPVRPRA
jgi:hypothetical protein